MYLYQYFILTALCGLYFNSKTSEAAITFLFGWYFYVTVTMYLNTEYYYAVTALVELLIGYKINKNFRLVSYLCYSLIIVNLFGLFLFKNGLQPLYYDIIYAIISIFQILLLITRVRNGRSRIRFQRLMDALVDFDSRKARDTM